VNRRWLVIALALAAACAFLFSVQIGRWWVIGDSEIGPHGMRHCFGEGDCKLGSITLLGGGDRWMRLGMATWAAGLVASFMLVVVAARLAAKRVPKLAAKSVLVAIAVAILTGGFFVANFPDVDGASLSRGALFFVIAIVLALVAAISVLRSADVKPPSPRR
jgi:hypothetical protein